MSRCLGGILRWKHFTRTTEISQISLLVISRYPDTQPSMRQQAKANIASGMIKANCYGNERQTESKA